MLGASPRRRFVAAITRADAVALAITRWPAMFAAVPLRIAAPSARPTARARRAVARAPAEEPGAYGPGPWTRSRPSSRTWLVTLSRSDARASLALDVAARRGPRGDGRSIGVELYQLAVGRMGRGGVRSRAPASFRASARPCPRPLLLVLDKLDASHQVVL
jgi:anti-sigma-K factor RskA